mmetsp:Transcript_108243/g.305077  ORF Transcript_108243/g.305077 Transcript_108243/m.305077 type:complete len:533 (+) Transcript_108243:62-1660(+)
MTRSDGRAAEVSPAAALSPAMSSPLRQPDFGSPSDSVGMPSPIRGHGTPASAIALQSTEASDGNTPQVLVVSNAETPLLTYDPVRSCVTVPETIGPSRRAIINHRGTSYEFMIPDNQRAGSRLTVQLRDPAYEMTPPRLAHAPSSWNNGGRPLAPGGEAVRESDREHVWREELAAMKAEQRAMHTENERLRQDIYVLREMHRTRSELDNERLKRCELLQEKEKLLGELVVTSETAELPPSARLRGTSGPEASVATDSARSSSGKLAPQQQASSDRMNTTNISGADAVADGSSGDHGPASKSDCNGCTAEAESTGNGCGGGGAAESESRSKGCGRDSAACSARTGSSSARAPDAGELPAAMSSGTLLAPVSEATQASTHGNFVVKKTVAPLGRQTIPRAMVVSSSQPLNSVGSMPPGHSATVADHRGLTATAPPSTMASTMQSPILELRRVREPTGLRSTLPPTLDSRTRLTTSAPQWGVPTSAAAAPSGAPFQEVRADAASYKIQPWHFAGMQAWANAGSATFRSRPLERRI